ncbi:MAG TPA: hypothetical protein VFH88_13680 [Candidatus Krumholzibacteria bacterium]|nr:hypothetical protein [Candidatus Krumholzibacteria bacterium]
MRALLSWVVVGSAFMLPCFTGAALADHLSIYSDPAFTTCTLTDASPGVVNVYVTETTYEATGVRFRIAPSAGFTGVWLSETSPFVTLGTSLNDLSIVYPACAIGTFPVLTVTYQLYGTSTCSALDIAPAEGFTLPICAPCAGEGACVGNISLHVNCAGSFDCNPLAVEPTTWGSVKALYRN